MTHFYAVPVPPSLAIARFLFFCAFFFFYIFKLEYICLAMLYYFLLYNKVNQLYVYIYSLPFEPLVQNPLHSSRSSQNTELSSLCYTAVLHKPSILHTIVYICQCYPPNVSHPLLSPPTVFTYLFSMSLSLFLPANKTYIYMDSRIWYHGSTHLKILPGLLFSWLTYLYILSSDSWKGNTTQNVRND